MTVDHIGVILYPDVEWLRVIGRLSYPLFAFLIAYGCIKTRNIARYFLRLIAFAVWLQIFWVIGGLIDPAIKPEFNNIFFTLALGVLAIWVIKLIFRTPLAKTPADKIFLTGIAATLAISICLTGEILQADYGLAGILLIVMFYVVLHASALPHLKTPTVPLSMKGVAAPQGLTGYVKKGFLLRAAGICLALLIFNLTHFLLHGWHTQLWSLAAIPFIWLFTDRRLKVSRLEKYAFYLYYPLHFVVLYIIFILN